MTRNEGSNGVYKRGVYRATTETIRKVCIETLQSLVSTFINMELEIKVTGSSEQQRQ
jgi:hypothetical protein